MLIECFVVALPGYKIQVTSTYEEESVLAKEDEVGPGNAGFS